MSLSMIESGCPLHVRGRPVPRLLLEAHHCSAVRLQLVTMNFRRYALARSGFSDLPRIMCFWAAVFYQICGREIKNLRSSRKQGFWASTEGAGASRATALADYSLKPLQNLRWSH
jgi:hypothetical protein